MWCTECNESPCTCPRHWIDDVVDKYLEQLREAQESKQLPTVTGRQVEVEVTISDASLYADAQSWYPSWR